VLTCGPTGTSGVDVGGVTGGVLGGKADNDTDKGILNSGVKLSGVTGGGGRAAAVLVVGIKASQVQVSKCETSQVLNIG